MAWSYLTQPAGGLTAVTSVPEAQQPKLKSVTNTEKALLVLGVDEHGALHFTTLARFTKRGTLQDGKVGHVTAAGKLVWA